MQKNTEDIGGIFDPQPSELTGNIQCISDPSETVIGFISCGVVREKRFFISSSEVLKINSDWLYKTDCRQDTIRSSRWKELGLTGNHIIDIVPKFLSLDPLYYYSRLECIDCTLFGTNIKPSFWPN
jgi:hypothetical protein